ncbi:hypothetical protein D6C44_002736 [Escherichia coli]|nr:hypothetical protein [Escherichia coli]EEY1458588.1 hypothetical protein [Escherichia coli]EJV3641341.1 hypothetical protein [Escherichia coli]EJV3685652.1 hypothetical protein [Escherichia coli]
MELKQRIITAKCANNPEFRDRYLRARVKPLAVVQDLMRRGCSDQLVQEDARQAIIDAIDLLLLHPETVHHIMAVVRAAHEIAREPAPKSSEPLNVFDLEQQIEDEF